MCHSESYLSACLLPIGPLCSGMEYCVYIAVNFLLASASSAAVQACLWCTLACNQPCVGLSSAYSLMPTCYFSGLGFRCNDCGSACLCPASDWLHPYVQTSLVVSLAWSLQVQQVKQSQAVTPAYLHPCLYLLLRRRPIASLQGPLSQQPSLQGL